MRKSMKTVLTVAAILGGLAAAPALYAHESGDDSRGQGMMGGMMQGRGMMQMMGQMSAMMENCNKMMQSMNHGGSGPPNEQWRKNAPETESAPGMDD